MVSKELGPQQLVLFYLPVHGLFNDSVNDSDSVLNERMIMNNELQRTRKEKLVA